MERENRSDKYQYVILEICCAPPVWENFTNQDSISHRLNPFHYDERILILEDQLKEEFWKLAKEICTEIQFKCMSLYCQGHTQHEIAKMLDVNQSSVVKSISGNPIYEGSKLVNRHGGAIKKLKKAIQKHQVIQSILQQIDVLIEEKF